jgi:hypothetical protein
VIVASTDPLLYDASCLCIEPALQFNQIFSPLGVRGTVDARIGGKTCWNEEH